MAHTLQSGYHWSLGMFDCDIASCKALHVDDGAWSYPFALVLGAVTSEEIDPVTGLEIQPFTSNA